MSFKISHEGNTVFALDGPLFLLGESFCEDQEDDKQEGTTFYPNEINLAKLLFLECFLIFHFWEVS